MASRTLISVEEYLRTSYRPDCDYVDGEVLERNVGEKSHAKLQKAILLFLSAREKELGSGCSRNSASRCARSAFASRTSASLWASRTKQILHQAALHLHRNPLSRRPLAPHSAAHRRLPRHGSTLRVGTGPRRPRRPIRPPLRKEPSKLPPESSRLRTLLSKFLLARSCNQIARSEFRPCRMGARVSIATPAIEPSTCPRSTDPASPSWSFSRG